MWRFKAGTLAGALPPTSQCVSVAKQLSSWNETPNLSVSAPDPRWKRNSTCLPGQRYRASAAMDVRALRTVPRTARAAQIFSVSVFTAAGTGGRRRREK